MFLLIFLVGLVIGSFLNVCIYRIPKGASIVWPGSHCSDCRRALSWHQLIPVISFLFLKGICSYCNQRISFRYPAIELTTGLIFLYLYQIYGLSWNFLTLTFLACLLLIIAFIDIDYQIIPNRLVFIGLLVGVILNMFSHNLNWLQLVLGFLAGGCALLVIALLFPGGMGGGDIKFAAMLGIYLGWPEILGVLFIASVFGAITGFSLIFFNKKTRQETIPFGPFLALGALVVLLKGEQVWNLYLKLMLN